MKGQTKEMKGQTKEMKGQTKEMKGQTKENDIRRRAMVIDIASMPMAKARKSASSPAAKGQKHEVFFPVARICRKVTGQNTSRRGAFPGAQALLTG